MSTTLRFEPAHTRHQPKQPALLDPDQVVDDTLILTTVDGAEDFLQADLSNLPDIQTMARHRAAITARVRGTLRTLHGCRLYASAAIPLPGRIDHEPLLEPLVISRRRGILQALTSDKALRFRVGTADSGLRKQVIGRVESLLGWINDPSGWDINIATDRRGWTAQIGALHYSQRFGSLDRQPWSTTPLVAETLIRLAKPMSGMRVHDPCCGTATLLIVAHHNTPGIQLTGTDHDQTTLAIAQTNLRRHNILAELTLANATPFHANSGSLDRVVANLPFGKQVGSHHHNATLYPAMLNETARTLTRTGRAVLLTEDKKLLRHAVQHTKGLKVIKERLLRYNGATPTAYVLTRTRR